MAGSNTVPAQPVDATPSDKSFLLVVAFVRIEIHREGTLFRSLARRSAARPGSIFDEKSAI
jgi:hypothetical protein